MTGWPDPWTPDEDAAILLGRELGETCTAISERLSGRTPGDCKNRLAYLRTCVREGVYPTYLPKRAPVDRKGVPIILKPAPQTHMFCGQCDRRVSVAEADACRSRWCKAKAVAA